MSSFHISYNGSDGYKRERPISGFPHDHSPNIPEPSTAIFPTLTPTHPLPRRPSQINLPRA